MMTDTADFYQRIAEAIRNGASVSTIERTFGISNRGVRKIKARMYADGVLVPKTPGRMAQVKHDHNR